MPEFPDVYFGTAESKPLDWRKYPDPDNDVDDDEVLPQTPKDVVEMLGFDPLDEDVSAKG